MKIDILLGLQWGDEGKGKVVDVLTQKYDYIARFQGGPNAGHTLVFNDIKHVLHTIPSGIFHEGIINVIGNGVVIDPILFKEEVDTLIEMGVDIHKKLKISSKAHLILPSHGLIDRESEKSKGKTKIGSTLKGIGPAYMDKTGRNGIRVGDIFLPDFDKIYQKLIYKHHDILQSLFTAYIDLEEFESKFFEGIELLKTLDVVDTEYFINRQLQDNKKILAEGAQGTLLDIDFGSYPFVTSSTTTAAGACTGLGIAPNKIGGVYGIFKAYCTRVGNGPFPTELTDDMGNKLRKCGNEYGATTGRPRRCGWLDLPALKYACMINGVTQLIMTKVDVLNTFDKIKVCTHNDTLQYHIFDGWNSELTNCKTIMDIPKELSVFIDFLEYELKIPIIMISIGPDRNQVLHTYK